MPQARYPAASTQHLQAHVCLVPEQILRSRKTSVLLLPQAVLRAVLTGWPPRANWTESSAEPGLPQAARSAAHRAALTRSAGNPSGRPMSSSPTALGPGATGPRWRSGSPGLALRSPSHALPSKERTYYPPAPWPTRAQSYLSCAVPQPGQHVCL